MLSQLCCNTYMTMYTIYSSSPIVSASRALWSTTSPSHILQYFTLQYSVSEILRHVSHRTPILFFQSAFTTIFLWYNSLSASWKLLFGVHFLQSVAICVKFWYNRCQGNQIVQIYRADQNFHSQLSTMCDITYWADISFFVLCHFDLDTLAYTIDTDTDHGRLDTGSDGVRILRCQSGLIRRRQYSISDYEIGDIFVKWGKCSFV